jgi:hypothetical protein
LSESRGCPISIVIKDSQSRQRRDGFTLDALDLGASSAFLNGKQNGIFSKFIPHIYIRTKKNHPNLLKY